MKFNALLITFILELLMSPTQAMDREFPLEEIRIIHQQKVKKKGSLQFYATNPYENCISFPYMYSQPTEASTIIIKSAPFHLNKGNYKIDISGNFKSKYLCSVLFIVFKIQEEFLEIPLISRVASHSITPGEFKDDFSFSMGKKGIVYLGITSGNSSFPSLDLRIDRFEITPNQFSSQKTTIWEIDLTEETDTSLSPSPTKISLISRLKQRVTKNFSSYSGPSSSEPLEKGFLMIGKFSDHSKPTSELLEEEFVMIEKNDKKG